MKLISKFLPNRNPLDSIAKRLNPYSQSCIRSPTRRGPLWRWRNSNYAVWIRPNKNVHSRSMFDFHCRIRLFCLWTQSEVTLLISENYHCNTSILARTVNESVWTVIVSMLLILWVILSNEHNFCLSSLLNRSS